MHRQNSALVGGGQLADNPAVRQIRLMSFETMHTLRRDPEVTPLFPELSVVVTLCDTVTDDGRSVAAGSRGTIVEVYAGGEAYEVEFARPVIGNATIRAEALKAA